MAMDNSPTLVIDNDMTSGVRSQDFQTCHRLLKGNRKATKAYITFPPAAEMTSNKPDFDREVYQGNSCPLNFLLPLMLIDLTRKAESANWKVYCGIKHLFLALYGLLSMWSLPDAPWFFAFFPALLAALAAPLHSVHISLCDLRSLTRWDPRNSVSSGPCSCSECVRVCVRWGERGTGGRGCTLTDVLGIGPKYVWNVSPTDTFITCLSERWQLL